MENFCINIRQDLIAEAADYARMSRKFTSNRHDFHEGGLSAKQRKMFEGKLGEKAIKQIFEKYKIMFEEDKTAHDQRDFYDFLVWGAKSGKKLKLDVKTRTKNFHTRTLEMVEQLQNNPKDIFISLRLYNNPYCAKIIGFALREDFININRVENQGYLDNYVLYDNELRHIGKLLDNLKKV